MMRYLWLLLILLSVMQAISASCTDPGYVKWNVSWAPEPRFDLYCKLSSYCSEKRTEVSSMEFDKCCACYSCAAWEGSEIDLLIEYISVLGKSLVTSGTSYNPDAVYMINNNHSDMIEIPSNLCNWDNDTHVTETFTQEYKNIQKYWRSIVTINFSNNKIHKLGDMNCLRRLDTLDLSHNRLLHVTNTSFPNLSYLRYIDFSGNLIQTIDPGILTSPLLNIFKADFSFNQLTKLDVSNMLSLYPFCQISFKSNEIKEMVNEVDFKLNMSHVYGPGSLQFEENKFETWPDWKELLNLDDISQMGKLLSFQIDFRKAPLVCDCNLQSFMAQAKSVIELLWHDYLNVTCTGPKELAGISVGKVDLDDFVCKTDAGPECPTPYCQCIDSPNANTLYVDCSYKEGSFLDYVPPVQMSKFSDFISLNFSGQQLKNITNLTRLVNVSFLDVSYNDIKELSNEIAKTLENATMVDLSYNTYLHQLPKAFFQYRNVCMTNMRDLKIDCNCESEWIETWLHSKSCIDEKYIFYCVLPSGKTIPALSFKAAELDCAHQFEYTREFLVSGAIILFSAAGMLIYIFRYEILILMVRIKQFGNISVKSKFDYDVFLSFNNDDDDVLKWINEFQKQLVCAGYRVFLPMRDIQFGLERDTEIISAIKNSRNFVITLTDNYLSQTESGSRSWTENEWKYGWYNFVRNRSTNIVLINLDHASSFDTDHSQIKAFLRVGCTVDFKNHDRKIMEEIFKKLGKPLLPNQLNRKALENQKPKFKPDALNRPEENIATAINREESDIVQDPQKKNITTKHKEAYPILEPKIDLFGPPFETDKGINNKKMKFKHKFEDIPEYINKKELHRTPQIPLYTKGVQTKPEQSQNPSFVRRERVRNMSKIYMNQRALIDKDGDIQVYSKNDKITEASDDFNVNLNNREIKRLSVKSFDSFRNDISPDMQEAEVTSEVNDTDSSVSYTTCSSLESSQISLNISIDSSSMTDISV